MVSLLEPEGLTNLDHHRNVERHAHEGTTRKPKDGRLYSNANAPFSAVSESIREKVLSYTGR